MHVSKHERTYVRTFPENLGDPQRLEACKDTTYEKIPPVPCGVDRIPRMSLMETASPLSV